MLELYRWEPNANSLKVMICLLEKGLKFNDHYVDILEFEQYARAFLELNPAGQVPVLVHEGEALAESTLICEFLEEAFPKTRLSPSTPRGWYELQAWGKFVDYNLAPSVSTLGWHMVMAPLVPQRDVQDIPVPERRAAWQSAFTGGGGEEQLSDSRRKVELALDRIENMLAASGWLMGTAYSLADIEAFSMAATLTRLLPDLANPQRYPRVADWLGRIEARGAVAEALSMRRSELAPDLYAPGPEHSRWG